MKRLAFVLLVFVSFALLGAVPDVARKLNEVAAEWVQARKFSHAHLVYKYLSWFGNLDAINNRAVLLKSGYGVKSDHKTAVAMLDEVAAKGHVAARYNLASLLPNRRKTSDRIIKRSFDLLEPNVQRGDTHSAVLYAARLKYKTRDSLVKDRHAKKLSLLKRAARTNNTRYMLHYARELTTQSRRLGDLDMFQKAVSVLRHADRLGNAQAAMDLASIQMLPPIGAKKKGLPAALIERSAIDWYRKSALSGSKRGTCELWLNLYYRASRILNPFVPHHLNKKQRSDIRYEEGRILMREAIVNLTKCTRYPPRQRGLVKVFGGAALRLDQRGDPDRIRRSTRGFANYYLGVAYANGLAVQRDMWRAKRYFKRAAKRYKNKPAQDVVDQGFGLNWPGLRRLYGHGRDCADTDNIRKCAAERRRHYVSRAHRRLRASWW